MTCLALDEMCVADDVAACLALKLMARYEYSCYIVDRQELFCFPYPFVSFKMFTDFYEFPVSHARQSCLPSFLQSCLCVHVAACDVTTAIHSHWSHDFVVLVGWKMCCNIGQCRV